MTDGSKGLDRLLLSGMGAAAGFALWYFTNVWPGDTGSPRLVMALVLGSGAFFWALLAVFGPLRPARAVATAAVIGLVPTGLFTWAGYRFDDVGQLMASGGHEIIAWALLTALPLPFAVAAERADETWRDYPALFGQAWDIVLRYGVASAFVAVVWGVVLLSDAVLKIVRIEVIGRLLDIEPGPLLLSGLALGFALAITREERAHISPTLFLRLFRLLLPAVFAVSAVFLLAAPINGFSRLFGWLSPAATLMAMAVAAVTLVTLTIERDAARAARVPVLVWSARLTSLMVPALGALALWGVWLRIAQYGLSPNRVSALTGAAIAVLYGLFYAGAVVLGRGWQDRIRRANVLLALGMIALAALWLTPALNVERLSARSQIARLDNGRTGAGALDLWTLAHDWGRAGRAAVNLLRDPARPDAARLAGPLARLDAAESRADWAQGGFAAGNGGGDAKALAELRRLLVVRPEGMALPEPIAGPDLMPELAEGCQRETPAGAPACVALIGPLLPGGAETVLFVFWSGHSNVLRAREPRAQPWSAGEDGLPETALHDPSLIDALRAGHFRLAPTQTEMFILDSGTRIGAVP